MTVASETNRSGPYTCNGSTVSFPYGFRIRDEDHLRVVKTSSTGVETNLTIGTDYSVTGVGSSGGGAVVTGSAYASGNTITIVLDVPFTQEIDLENQGAYYAETVEEALDLSVQRDLQMKEELARSVKVPVSSSDQIIVTKELIDNLAIVSGDIANVNTVASLAGDIEVIIAELPGIPEAVAASAASAAAALEYSEDASGSAAAAAASFDSFDDRYLGSKASNPSTDNDGNPLLTGALYWNSTVSRMRSWDGSAWANVVDGGMLSVLDYGAIPDNATDNTAAVQAALDALPDVGGAILIPHGCKFRSHGLTRPERSALEYRMDDDLSQRNPYSTAASGELVESIALSGYPTQGAGGGAVNEKRLRGSMHPGYVVDVDKTDPSHDAHINAGAGQTRMAPVRASYNIFDEGLGTWRIVYENHLPRSKWSGVYYHNFKGLIKLNGIGTAQWSSVPAVGTTITGTTSGAIGFVVAVAAGYTEVEWFSGRFDVGEAVSDDNETTTAVITTADFSYKTLASLAQNLTNGGWTFGGVAPGDATEMVTVAGNVIVVPDNSSAPVRPKDVVKPGFYWGGAGANVTVVGLQVDPSKAANARRVDFVTAAKTADLEASAAWRGTIAPVGAMVQFSAALIVDTNCINVASLAKTATGTYRVTFTRSLYRAYGIPLLSKEGYNMRGWSVDYVYAFGASAAYIDIYVSTGGTLTDIPSGGSVSLVILGTDVS